MSSTRACRFIAASADPGSLAAAIVLVFALCPLLRAADCPDQKISAQEKLSRFKQLDQEAESAMRQHRPEQAVQLYSQAVCLVPNSARGFFGLGVAQAAAGEFLDARESLRTADRLQPTTPSPLLMQVRVNLSLNDLDTLKADLTETAKRFPHDGPAHQELAHLLAEKNLFVLSLAEALRSQQAGVGDPASKVQLAVLENTVGAYEDAIHNAVAICENHSLPDDVRAAAAGVVGLSYESLANSAEAIRYLKEAIRLDAAQDNSYLALADLYDQSQKYAEAVALLREARLRIPTSLAVKLQLGLDLVRAEHFEEGIGVLRDVIREVPNTPEAYVGLADAARKAGKHEQEIAALNALQLIQPAYPMLHVLIARAMLNSDHPDYPKLLEQLTQAENSSPSDSDIYYLRGKAYLALSRYADAVAALRTAVELRPMETNAYYQLARAYQKLGRSEMAREQFERIRYLESAQPVKLPQ